MRWLWIASLACFVLAALTGATMRFGMMHGLPWGLEFVNVRHAHSHLMYFSWVTPLLMALTADLAWPAERRRLGWLLGLLALGTGALTYVPFLLSGYGELAVAGRELPLSMMAAGLSGVAWYLFVILHFHFNRGRLRTVPLRALDGAVVLLLLASLAVTAVPLVAMMGDGDGMIVPLIGLFLEAFGEGWFTLALLTLACGQLHEDRRDPPAQHGEVVGDPAQAQKSAGSSIEATGGSAQAGIILLTVGVVLRSLSNLALGMGIGEAQLPALLGAWSASVGTVVVLWALLGRLARVDQAWLTPLLFVLLKALVDPFLAWQGVGLWSEGMGFRILFLHAFLLGAVSLGLVAAVRHYVGAIDRVGVGVFTVAVLVLLLALIPLTGLWPAAWSGPWILRVAAWTSLAPPLAAIVAIVLNSRTSAGRRVGGVAPHS